MQLAKTGPKNPILALAQLASGFSKESFEKTIGKLQEIRDNLEIQLAEE